MWSVGPDARCPGAVILRRPLRHAATVGSALAQSPRCPGQTERRPDLDRFDDACQLWAGRFQAVITTHSLADPGYPFASAVPYCLDACGNALLLLSYLAQHTQNLGADARCGLSVVQATAGDVQQSLRLACTADCMNVDTADAASHRRWFRYYPSSRRYFEQLNFRLYRLIPRRFHVNGGFGTARWLDSTRILRVSPFDEVQELALIQTAQGMSDALWPDPADQSTSDPIRIVGVDPWGLDLARGDTLRRVPLPEPIADLDHLRLALLAQTGG